MVVPASFTSLGWYFPSLHGGCSSKAVGSSIIMLANITLGAVTQVDTIVQLARFKAVGIGRSPSLVFKKKNVLLASVTSVCLKT